MSPFELPIGSHERRYSLRFWLQSVFAYARGICRFGVVNKSKRQLLVGKNVAFMLHTGGRVELAPATGVQAKVSAQNQFYPLASAIGFVPFWKYMNPPARRNSSLRIQNHARLLLGANTLIAAGAYISVWPGQTLEIGENTYIGQDSFINTKMGLKIGANTMFSHNVTIMDYDGHPIYRGHAPDTSGQYGGEGRAIEIGDGVWVGFGVTILKGVKIGSGAIVGAGSVVTSDVPANSVVAGNPARVVESGVSWRQF